MDGRRTKDMLHAVPHQSDHPRIQQTQLCAIHEMEAVEDAGEELDAVQRQDEGGEAGAVREGARPDLDKLEQAHVLIEMI